VTGERLSQAGWLSPSQAASQGVGAEAGFTSSSGGVRAPSVTRSRNLAARSDEKPFRAESSNAGGFRAGVNRSYPEGRWLLLCPARDRRLWRFCASGIRPRKDAERRDKMSVCAGEDTGSRQDS
jgi:hypothetical protein